MDIFKTIEMTAAYGQDEVLKDLNFSIESGDFISIIGPNGAGKSTLLNILSGENSPVKGEVLFKNRNLNEISRNELSKKISIVHQNSHYPHPFTVYEFIKMGRFPHQKFFQIESSEDRNAVNEAIELTGIERFKFKKITELSTGEMQLVNISRAFVQSREVILLDEPISHLDLFHSIKIMDILQELNKRGSTIISILHDVNITIQYAKKVAAIKNGKIAIEGKPEDVLNRDSLRELYEIDFTLVHNPETGKPAVFPVSEGI